VAIVQRDPARGRATAARLGLLFVPRAELDPRRFDLLVNATPLGRGAADELPAPVAELERHAVVVDLVYGGEPTRWVADARRRGLVAIDGREVLIFQARPQFRAMTGHDLPLALAWKLAGLAEETA
jgi:shikimate 5-dehydrogenase